MILFSTGFRPFFLCAGLAAAGLMVVWLLGYTKRDPLLTYYGSSGWHAHEMLFGYSVAVVAGFLLSAVRQWTNSETMGGLPLVGLIVLWLAGRILPLYLSIPHWLVALVDMAFLPALATILAKPLIRARQRGNILVLILLGVLMIANALIHSEWLGLTAGSARLGEVLAIYTLVLLITMMAGRVIPSFIADAIPNAKVSLRPLTESMSILSVVLLGLSDLFSPSVQLVEVFALLAALVHAWRLRGWIVSAAMTRPLLWVLLLGYAWVVVGFVLLAVAYSGRIPTMIAFHALMVGGIGVLTLGMMAHAAMGHTGRPMQAPPLAALAFVLINATAAVRVLGPLLTVRYTKAVISAAGALWITSFVLFLVVYLPILLQPRVDGDTG